MASKTTRAGGESGTLNLLRGGKTLPKGLVSGHIADVERRIQSQFKATNGVERRMAKAWSQIQHRTKPTPPDPVAASGLSNLLGIHTKLGGTKLKPPKLPRQWGGILAGSISAKVLPPFDFAFTIPTVEFGDPIMFAAASKNGQISGSAVTATDTFNSGGVYAEVGVYFHPMTAGTLRLSASPVFSFQWWTNSLPPGFPVTSLGGIALGIYGVDPNAAILEQPSVLATAGADFKQWQEYATQQTNFDAGSDLQYPLSIELDVNHDLVYLLFVSLEVNVEGAGWPGSLAGSMLSATVPFLTWEFVMRPPAVLEL